MAGMVAGSEGLPKRAGAVKVRRMKRLMTAVAFAAAASQVGCATLFTGTSEDLTIESDPPNAVVVVIGGTVGNLLVRASQATSVAQKIFDVLDPHLGTELRETLRKVDLNELIAALGTLARLNRIPTGLVDDVRSVVEKIPRPIAEKAMEVLGLDHVGTTPTKCRIGKGGPTAVIAWAEGHHPRMESVDVRFNWVAVLNVFNFFIGLAIDIPTGAWLEPKTDRLRIRLKKRE